MPDTLAVACMRRAVGPGTFRPWRAPASLAYGDPMTDPIGLAGTSKQTRRSRRLLLLALAIALALGLFGATRLAATGCSPFPGAACMRVLFLGNSYTYVNDLPAVFAELARSAGKNVETGMVASGGETLAQHAASAESLDAIRNTRWQFVVLQEQSEIPAVEALRQGQMYAAARSLADAIRAAGATPVLLETWAHREGWPNDRLDYAAMQAAIDRAYLALAGQLGVGVATAGEAWQAALSQDPTVALWQADGSHPSQAGTYLAACVLYARILGASPVGIAEDEGLSSDVAHALQVIAAELN